MEASKKRPKIKKEVEIKKEPKIDKDPDDYKGKPIVWKLGSMVLCEKRKWNWCQLKDEKLLKKVLERLGQIETQYAIELNGKKSHVIEIGHFKNKDVHKELRHLGLVDVTGLFSLRINSVCRVFCTYNGNEFSLLWLDPKHEVYPVDP